MPQEPLKIVKSEPLSITQSEPTEGAVSRFAGGAGQYLNPINAASFLYNFAVHPEQTGAGIINAGMEQLNQVKPAIQSGRPGEAAFRILAGSVPLIGPPVANAIDKIRSGDVAGGAGEMTGIIGPALLSPALRASESAVRAVPGARGMVSKAAGALERSAQERLTNAMAPKVGQNKLRFGGAAEKIAPELLAAESGPGGALRSWTRGGMANRVADQLANAEAALDAAADARNPGAAFATKPILDALLEKRRALTAEAVDASRPVPTLEGSGGRPLQTGTVRDIRSGQIKPSLDKSGRPIGQDVVPAPNAARVAQIDQAIAEIQRLGPQARYESLRRIRQAYDGPAKAVYNPSMTADFLNAQGGKLGAADVTGVLRDSLAKMDPQTAAANAQYSLYRNANDVLEAAAETERARPKVGRTIFAGAAGGLAAGKWGAPIAIILDRAATELQPGMQIRLARTMQAAANALRAGRTTQANNLLRVLIKDAAGAGIRAGGGQQFPVATGMAGSEMFPVNGPQVAGVK